MSETPSTASTEFLEVRNSAERGVRIEFHWTGDRFSHTLLDLQGEIAKPLLESIEGSAEERFPPSPPFLEIHRQDEALFLSGATDAGYWSMSVEIANSQELPATNFLLFDVACRLRRECKSLQSMYKSMVPDGRFVTSDRSTSLQCSAGEATHSILVGPAPQHPLGCQVTCESEPAGTSTLCIGPTTELPSDFPATVRWQYGIFIPTD